MQYSKTPKLVAAGSLFVATFLLTAACEETPTSSSVPFRRVAAGSGGRGEGLQVVRDASVWNDFLSRTRTNQPPQPIDFSSEMALVVSLGGSACNKVIVEDVRLRARTLEVTAVLERQCGACIAVFAPSFAAVAVRRNARAVTLEQLERLAPCP